MLDRRFCHRVWYCLALGALAFVTACTWEGASGPVESPSSAADSPEVGVPESEPPAAPLGPPPPPCASFQNIRPQQLATMLEDKDFLLINTNPPFYAKIESTDDHLPLDSPTDWIERYPADQDTKIVLYCHSGYTSLYAARELQNEGYTQVFNLEGGITAWEAAGFPVIRFE